jgi:hypothetical protein
MFPIRHLLQADPVHIWNRYKKWNTPFLYVLNTSFLEIIIVGFKLFTGLINPLPFILVADLAQQM